MGGSCCCVRCCGRSDGIKADVTTVDRKMGREHFIWTNGVVLRLVAGRRNDANDQQIKRTLATARAAARTC